MTEPAGPLGRLLTSEAGRALLDALPPYAADTALAVATRLRAQGHDPDLVTAALGQARLRSLAAAKFGAAAATLHFTADGLEQATRPELADRHAARFAAAGITEVLDLGCGIGSDAMALARAGRSVTAVDADPDTAAVAAANLAPWPNARVVVGLAQQVPLPTSGAARHTGVWVDPARRAGVRDTHGRARRLVALEAIEPSWTQVLGFAAAVPATGAKLSPAFPRSALPAGCEAQWTSWRGELLECVVWWGPLVGTPGRTAAVCRPGPTPGSCQEVVVGEAEAAAGEAAAQPALTGPDGLGDWLWETDKAVLRAGLTGALPGREISLGVGLSTGAAPVDLPWARRYAVRDALPARPRVLRAWLRERGVGRLTVKKRGSALDPDRFRREVGALAGTGAATVLLTTIGSQATVIVLETPATDA